RLGITSDGVFAFETRLDAGAWYEVSLVGTPRCVLAGSTGTAGEPAPALVLTCEGVVALVDLYVSGFVSELDFTPGRLEYTLDAPLLQDSVTVTATPASAAATMTIAGIPASSGTPSPPLPLALGASEIAVVVAHPAGLQRTYRVTVRRASALMQYAYGKASNTGAADELGHTISLDGDLLAVGAPGEDSASQGVGGDQTSEAAPQSGAVYVFRRVGAAWMQDAYLKASNTDPDDRFGTSVALAGDRLVVGAPHEDSTGMAAGPGNDGAPQSGAVYVFRRSGATWVQEAYLKASNAGAYDYFGRSVSLSGDVLAVGAPLEDSAATGVGGNQASEAAQQSGAVYVFRRSGAAWMQEAYVKASNTGAGDEFGDSVALDGDVLAVGAYAEDSASTGVNGNQQNESASFSGAVYVFRRSGAMWAQEAYLKASNTGAGDHFGDAVAVSGDAVVAGAPNEDSADGNLSDDSAFQSGAVYVFRCTGAAWEQEAYLKAAVIGAGDRLGTSVAVRGTALATGAIGEDSASPGVGGNASDDSVRESGAVYLFRYLEGAWLQDAYIKASTTGADDRFGTSVAVGAHALAASASYEDSASQGVGGSETDDSAPQSGAIYIFH
ncbi:MAG TPA: cadherin-like beta sandwich domain-containing protein, partial [Haliangium sp.]|nr:cadherin-like beta sandwich domain-containing protein [Haliangium sp.]